MLKTVAKQLNIIDQNGLPFKYQLKFLAEAPVQVENDDIKKDTVILQEFWSWEARKHVNIPCIYVTVLIERANCPILEKDYEADMHIYLPSSYPFAPPGIYVGEDYIHPQLMGYPKAGNQIATCDFCFIMTLSNLIIDTYLIILEALNDPRNSIHVAPS